SASTDLSALTSEKAFDLLKAIGDFPAVIAEAAEKQAPHRITNYVHDLSSTLHSYYNAERVIVKDDRATTEARLALMQATKTTMKNALPLVGVEAPEKM